VYLAVFFVISRVVLNCGVSGERKFIIWRVGGF